jgi:hypothetical protein
VPQANLTTYQTNWTDYSSVISGYTP